VVYISFIKIIKRIDYISVEQHIYSMTLFYKIGVKPEETNLEQVKKEEIKKIEKFEEIKTAPEMLNAKDKSDKKENTAIPTAPGQNFLRVTGIFYIVASILIIFSALTIRYVDLGKLERNEDGSVTVVREITRFNSFMNRSASDVMPVWNLTAVNSVLVVFEQFHIIAPDLLNRSISNFVKEFDIERTILYAICLRGSVSKTIWSVILTFIAVIIGIFIGVMGITAVKYCATLKRTKLLLICALINLGMMAVSTVFLVSFLSLLGCVIAVLYFAGAFKNYKSVGINI
jgi:hypothetical protein